MNGDDGFVLVKGIAGTGNRILAFLSGLLYARLTGRRLVVDWCDGSYAPPDLNAFPLLFRSQRARPLDSLPPFPSVTPWIWQGHLRSTALEVRMAFEQGPLPSAAFAGQLFSFDIDAAPVLVPAALSAMQGR
jgi:hypothetical protein